MVVICHMLSMFSDPGENPIWEKNLDNVDSLPEELYCKKCLLVRPERAHHCKICQKCILKMDHHCPWVANCVGLKNLKYFCLFLFYATCGNSIAFISLLTKIFYIDIDAKINEVYGNNADSNIGYSKNKNYTALDLVLALKDPLICIMGTILAFFMSVSIGFLFSVQLLNLIKNKTTIELKIYDNKDSPYKHENIIDNIKSVLGKNKIFWFIPVYHNDEKYNRKKDKKQSNYLSLSDIDDNNLELNIAEF